MRLSRQILLIALIPALFTLIVLSGLAAFGALKNVRDDAEVRLATVEETRREELKAYLNGIRSDLTVFADLPATKEALGQFSAAWQWMEGEGTDPKERLQKLYITDNPNPTGEKEKLDDAGDGSLYSQAHSKHHPGFRSLLQERGYYDIFIFNAKGDLIYSVFKELDYATNMNTGEWKDTDLANSFRAAIEKASVEDHSFFDFRPYGPSYDAPASFISAPIVVDGKTMGVLAFQMPVDRLNDLISQQIGLGETGEALVVGEDFLARNDTALTEDSILQRRVENDAVRAALSGETGFAEIEMDGKERLAHYNTLEFLGTRYAFIVSETMDEIYAPIGQLMLIVLLEAVVIGVVVGAAGYYFGRRLSKPIEEIAEVQTALANGQLDAWVPEIKSPIEVGSLCKAMYKFKQETRAAERYREEQEQFRIDTRRKQREIVVKLADDFESAVGAVIEALSSSSTELSATSQEVSTIANRTAERSTQVRNFAGDASADIETVTASVEEVNSAVGEVATRITEITTMTTEAANEARSAAGRVEELNKASAKIRDIVSLISDIAEQTNLLALNATIEAARAGEAGKGFAVVANEVKALASQTQKATDEIGTQVSGMLSGIEQSTVAVFRISETSMKTSETMTSIAGAVEEQAATTEELSRAAKAAFEKLQSVIDQINSVAEDATSTGGATEELQASAAELSRSSNTLTRETQAFIDHIRSDPEANT